jgi:hypothetical protein
MARELVITNGDEAATVLREAGIGAGPGDVILPWRDVLYEGPVPLTGDLPSLSRIRADHLTMRGWATGRGLQAEFRTRDAIIASHADFDLVTLWFEQDFYDTLQLLQVLDFFAGEERDRDTLRIVHADKHLTRLSPDALKALAADPRPVGGARLNQAREAWAFWRAPDPTRWCDLGSRPRLELKHLWHAVLTSTGHVPAASNGLTVPQRHILESLADGPRTRNQLFAGFSVWCDRIGGAYMSDLSFFAVVDDLVSARRPLVAKAVVDAGPSDQPTTSNQHPLKAPLAITEFGRDVLTGRTDFAAHNVIDTWLGGTHITNESLWRRDIETHRLLPPR